MPKEVTREVRKNSQSPYPVPTSAAEPIQLDECIKIRTGELLRHRELCGNTIISRGRRKRSFQAEYRKCHMKPTICNYSRTKNKASVSPEQQAHGLVDRDILLTGGEKNIIKMFHEGAILSSTSDVSCVKLLTSAREVADSVSNHVVVTTRGSGDVTASVTVIDISRPLDFIKELTERAWIYTEKKNRRTLQRDGALRDDDLFSFLHNTVTMPEEATDDDDDDDDEESPPPPEEEAANDVVQQIYFPEPYQLHYADHHPFSYPMMNNTSNMMNRFEGSSSSAANNPPAIDPRIAYGLNLHDISPIGWEMPPSFVSSSSSTAAV